MLIQVIGFLLLTAIICLVVLVPKDGSPLRIITVS
jgi:hypothetical protein